MQTYQKFGTITFYFSKRLTPHDTDLNINIIGASTVQTSNEGLRVLVRL